MALLNCPQNKVIYDKKKDAAQRTSGSTVPSVLNDASFYTSIITQDTAKSSETAQNDDIAPVGTNAQMSLSGGETTQYGNYNVSGKDIALDIAPVAENATVQEKTQLNKNNSTDRLPDNFAPVCEWLENCISRRKCRKTECRKPAQSESNPLSRVF